MSESRDSRWMLIQGFPGAEVVRDLMRDAMRRLDDLDRNATALAIPALAITTAMLGTGVVTVAKMAADAVDSAQIVARAVTKSKLAGGFLGCKAIAGGAAGALTVSGIAVGDELVAVLRLDRDATASNINLTTLTSEFSITDTDTIANAGGTNTTGDALLVLWLDLT